MREIELKLVAPNQSAVKSVRELAAESEKLYKNNEKNQKRQIGLIEDVEHELARLQLAQKGAMSVESITKYNQKIAEAKKSIEEYNKAGVEGNKEVEKTSEGVLGKIGKMALAYLTVTTAIKLAKETVLAFFTKTEQGADLVQRKIAGLKAAWSVLAGEFVSGGKKMADAFEKPEKKSRQFWTFISEVLGPAWLGLGVRMDQAAVAAENYTRALQEIEDAERAMIVPRAKANAEIIKARLLYADDTKSITVRIAALEKALKLEQETADEEIKLQQWTILNLRDINNEKEKTGQLRDEDRKAMEEAIAKEIQLQSESNQRQVRATNSLSAAKKEFYDGEKKAREDEEKAIAKHHKDVRELYKKLWDDLVKDEKANNEFDKNLRSLLGVSDESLGIQENSKWLSDVKKARKAIADQEKGGTEEGESILGKMGLDDDQQAALREGVNAVKQAMDDIYNARVADAQRTRELAQDRLSQAQQELETEVELYKAGYSSNVAAKKKEVEQLKLQRDQALKNEEKQIKAQRMFDTLSQTSSLVTAAAKTFKVFNGPLLPVAIALVAAMFGAFAVAKSKANKATKLARGGHGTVNGRLHSEGGEGFLDHVEIEQGERWGVLSRSASRKYGPTFNKMVDSFNKESLPVPRQGINLISVQNDGPNKRLDEVNSNLRRIRTKEEVIVSGNTTIYKKGNSIRIVKR